MTTTKPAPTKPVLAYTVAELAAASGWGVKLLLDEIRNNRLPAKKKGGKGYTIRVDDAKKWLDNLPDAGS